MDVLVVNAGSTSLKLNLVRRGDSEPVEGFVPADAVGHRVVHGGDLTEPRLVDDELAPIEAACAAGDRDMVALFSGLVKVGADGAAKVPLDIPDFNGELRLMAVAMSDRKLGAADRALTVRDPVVAAIVLPRFLAPGDHADVALHQALGLRDEVAMEQAHQEIDFSRRTLPVLARKREQGQVRDAEFARGLDRGAHRVLAAAMPFIAAQPAALGPSSVAVHHDCDMARQSRGIERETGEIFQR